jgi:hypothetical protein
VTVKLTPSLLLRILGASRESDPTSGTIYVVVRRRYTFLAAGLRKAFEGQEDVRIIVDRRQGDRRKRSWSVATERRRSDRRTNQEELFDIVIVPRSPDSCPPERAP